MSIRLVSTHDDRRWAWFRWNINTDSSFEYLLTSDTTDGNGNDGYEKSTNSDQQPKGNFTSIITWNTDRDMAEGSSEITYVGRIEEASSKKHKKLKREKKLTASLYDIPSRRVLVLSLSTTHEQIVTIRETTRSNWADVTAASISLYTCRREASSTITISPYYYNSFSSQSDDWERMRKKEKERERERERKATLCWPDASKKLAIAYLHASRRVRRLKWMMTDGVCSPWLASIYSTLDFSLLFLSENGASTIKWRLYLWREQNRRAKREKKQPMFDIFTWRPAWSNPSIYIESENIDRWTSTVVRHPKRTHLIASIEIGTQSFSIHLNETAQLQSESLSFIRWIMFELAFRVSDQQFCSLCHEWSVLQKQSPVLQSSLNIDLYL